jgi:hypothetical protein
MNVWHTPVRVAAALFVCTCLAAQQPPAKHLLRLAFETGKSQFVRLSMSMHMQHGDVVQMAMNSAMTIENRVESVEGGKATVAQTVRRLVFVIAGPPRIVYDSDDPASKPGLLKGMADMVGKTFRMSIDARGRIGDVRVPEDFDDERAFGPLVGVDVKDLFGKGMPEFPDLPVAIGGTWTNDVEMPARRLGTMKMKVVNKLLSVDRGKATVAQTQQIDSEGVALPGGGKLTMELDLSEGTSVIDLATGRQLEVSNDVVMKTDAGAAGMTMSTSVRMRAIDAPRAKEAVPAPVELPESTQGKAVVLEDVVLTIRHAPGSEVECADFTAGRDCTAAEHWRAAFTAIDGERLVVVPAEKVDQGVLGNVLVDTAAVRRRLPGGHWRSEAQLLVRASRGTPFGVVRRIIDEAVSAGITRIAFAAQSPGARARVVSVPLEVPEPPEQPDAIEEVRVALLLDQARLVRKFGRTVVADGEAGDQQLRGLFEAVLGDWRRLGKSDVPGVIDAGSPVRWQEIIHQHDQMRAAGFETVRFAGLNAVK